MLIIGKSYVLLSYQSNFKQLHALLDVVSKVVRFAGGVEVSLKTGAPVEGCGVDKVIIPGTNIAVDLLNGRITAIKCGSYYSQPQSDAKPPQGRMLGGVNNDVSF